MEQHTDAHRDAECHCDGVERRADGDIHAGCDHGQDAVGRHRDDIAQHDAEETAQRRGGGSLHHELRQDDPLLGTQCLADADLAGALGDG